MVKNQPFQRRVKISTKGDWVLYGSNFKLQQKGKGNSVLTIPANSGVNYLTLLGEKGSRINIEAEKMAAKN